jgi:hypothetical protein
MAMHVALGRALAQGSQLLSPAWGTVHATVYPRGFSAVVALLWPLGPARAGLLAAGLSYIAFQVSFAAFLARPVRAPHPAAAAGLAVLLARAPQSFFGWGGNPSVLALALAIGAAARLARAGEPPPPCVSYPDATARLTRASAAAALLLGGAAATHPMSAAAGALCLIPVILRGPRGRLAIAAAVAMVPALGVAALLSRGGPMLSARELAWMQDYALRQEGVLRGPFALDVWRAIPRVLGDPWTVTCAVSAALLLAGARLWPLAQQARHPCAVGLSAAAVLILGALFALLPRLPRVGPLLYPARFAPLLLVATAPLPALAARALRPRHLAIVAAGLLAIAVWHHLRWYQRAEPIATWADVAALRCLDARVAPTAVIDGAYGDATQWIPALAGRAITRPHQHCSLFDECDAALSTLQPTHFFRGEGIRYGEPVDRPTPPGQLICAEGAAALWTLPPSGR